MKEKGKCLIYFFSFLRKPSDPDDDYGDDTFSQYVCTGPKYSQTLFCFVFLNEDTLKYILMMMLD